MTAGEINPEDFSCGYDRLRFIKLVFIGDTICCWVTIGDNRYYKKPELGMVVEKVEVFNQHGDTVMVCDHLLLANRREPPE